MAKRTITINDVAKAAGVSRSTVSRVLRGETRYIREETRHRVLEAATELDYHPNSLAQALKTRKSGLVGVIVDNIESPFASPLIAGIQEHLTARGLVAIVLSSGTDPRERASTVGSFLRRQVDGIIFAMTWVRTVDLKLTRDVPIALAYSSFPSLTVPSVLPDDSGGIITGMRHLMDLGHRRIGFINGPEDWVSAQQRMEAYRHLVRQYALPTQPHWVASGEWEDMESGRKAALQMLAAENPERRPTAIFAANDILAVGVIDAATSLGLHVPLDLSVLGFDDRDLCVFVRPQLSTIALPLKEIGGQAARGLLEVIDGNTGRWPLIVPCPLVERSSTGPCPMLQSHHQSTG